MKRTLSLVLALVMVLGSFSAVFAAEQTVEEKAAAILKEAEVLVGDASGDLMLEKALLRQDAVILLSKLMGEFDTAKEFPMVPTFKDITDNFYVPFLGWSLSNGTFVGHSAEKFGFNDNLTAQEYASVLLRVLGYEVKWDETLAKAKELGLLADIDLNAGFLRGQMAVMTVNALGTKINGSTETLAAKLEIEMPVVEPVKATKVEKVYANNLKEIVVEFDGPVDEASASKITNYSLDGNTLQLPAVAVVKENTVTIQLRTLGMLTNQRNHKLAVKGISGVTNVEMTFAPLDVTVPVVEKVEVLGNKVVNVTFSEPVRDASATTRANYRIDGFVVNGNITLSKNLRTATINLYTRLTAGEHKISVVGVNDYANMTIVNYLDQVITVVDDKVAPEAFEVDEATLDYAVVVFNEPIDETSLLAGNIYWSDNAGTTKYFASSVDRVDATHLTYEIGFPASRRLPARETTLYIEKAMDMYGNTAAKLSSAINASVDTVRPEITEIDFATDVNGNYFSSNQIDLTWNKVIATSQFEGVNAQNITVKNSSGDVVAIGLSASHVVNTGNKVIRVTLTNSLTQGSVYTIEVKNVTDGTALDNKMIPQTFTKTVPEYTRPSVVNVNAQKIVSGGAFLETNIQVVFSNVMSLGGQNSMLDTTKYMVRVSDTLGATTGTWYVLPQGSVIQPSFDNRAAIISVPQGARYDGINKLEDKFVTAVKVSLVEDRSGNLLVTDEIFNTDTARWGLTASKIMTTSNREAVATGKKSIRLTYDRPLQYVVPTDFTLEGAPGVTVVNAEHKAITLADGTSRGEVILTLSANLAAAPTVQVRVKANPDSRDLLGNAIATELSAVVRDGIAPSLLKATTTDTGINATTPNTIVVAFDEAIQTAYSSHIAGMFIVTAGLNDEVLVPEEDYTAVIGSSNDTVVITLNTGNNLRMTVATNDNNMMILDSNGVTTGSLAKASKVKFGKTVVGNVGIIDVASLSNATVTSTVYTVDSTADTIVGVPFGTTLAAFKANLLLPVGASITTDPVNDPIQNGDTITITAANGSTTKTYAISVVAASTNATVTSTDYIVTTNNIAGVPASTDVAAFKAKLIPAAGATFEVYQTDGSTVRVGNVVAGDKVTVTAQDGSTTHTYTIVLD